MANPKDKKRAEKKKAQAKLALKKDAARRADERKNPDAHAAGWEPARPVPDAPKLPVVEDLPTREELAGVTADTEQVVAYPEGFPDSLKKLHQRILRGEYSPEDHLKAVMERHRLAAEKRELEEQLYEKLRQTTAAPWRGKETEFAEVLWLRADTWEEFNLFPDLPTCPHDGYFLTREGWEKYTIRVPGTNFFYSNKTLPVSYSLSTAMSRQQEGKVFFDGPVVMPVLFEQKGPDEDFHQEVWMGLTPMEMMTQKAGIDRARGRCVVGGLGLGWFLKEIAAKPEVREIVVVEKSQELIDFMRPALEAQFPDVARKVKEWLPGDVYDYITWELRLKGFPRPGWDFQNDTCYLLDIWPAFGDADYDHRYVELEQHLESRLWGWGRWATHGGKPTHIDPHQRLPFERAYVRKNPCSGCPFSRTGKPSPTAVDPLRLVGQAEGPFLLPCHQEPQYEEERQGRIYEKAQCAGAAVYRANRGIGGLFPKSFHILDADAGKVFTTPAELVAAYKKIPLAEAEAILAENPPGELLQRELARNQVRVYGAGRKPS